MIVNLKNITPATWVRIIALLLVLINQIAVSFFGFDLGLDDQQIAEGVSTVVTAIVSIITAWKNNSVTAEAQKADRIMKNEKAKG